MPPSRVRLKDIAKNLGLEISTVAKAWRGHPAIARATRARVKAEAERIGYVPDPMLTSLSAYRSARRPRSYQATIGWLYNYARETDMTRFSGYSTGSSEFARGARDRAEQLGYKLEEFFADGRKMKLPRIADIFRARRIEGVVIAPQAEVAAEMEFPWEEFSAVTIGFSLKRPRLHSVVNDHFETMLGLVGELQRRGCARIGLFLDRVDNERMERRFQSVIATYAGAMRGAIQIYDVAKAQAFLRWFEHGNFDGLITGSKLTIGWLKEAGWRIPEEVGVVHYALNSDDTLLSGMHHNFRLIGAAAVDQVIAQLNRSDRGIPMTPMRLMVDSRWIEGTTVRAAID